MIKQYFKLPVLLLALSMLLIIACGEGEDDEEMHVDADGFILEVDEKEVYRQFQGTETGGISLKVGDELDVHVVFINHDSEEISFAEDHHDEEEEEGHDEEEAFGLVLSEYDTSIIEIHLPEDHEEEDDHDDEEDHHDDEFAFEVIGRRAGQTGIKLELFHGDHADFTAALPIPVTVSP